MFYIFYIALPPSTSKLVAVINRDASLAKNKHALATSAASHNRPRGKLLVKLALFIQLELNKTSLIALHHKTSSSPP